MREPLLVFAIVTALSALFAAVGAVVPFVRANLHVPIAVTFFYAPALAARRMGREFDYEAAGLRDYGRIDVRLAHDEAIYIVEANPNPYLAEGEDLAWAAEEGGHAYPDFIEEIAEMAISRHASRG